MKLGVQLGYFGAQPTENIVAIAQEAETLGYETIWTAEAWGSDVFTPLSWIGAHTSKIKLLPKAPIKENITYVNA